MYRQLIIMGFLSQVGFLAPANLINNSFIFLICFLQLFMAALEQELVCETSVEAYLIVILW